MDKVKQEHLRQQILSLVEEYYQEAFAGTQPFVPGESKVNYAGRVFDEREMVNLVDSSLEFWLTYGRYSREFEHRLAEYLGVRFALLVNSGSSANLLAFMALTSPLLGDRMVCRGDEVITVAAGFPTTVAPIVQYGAVPVFVDVELGTSNIDAGLIEQAISPKTKAVMMAHTLGNPFPIAEVQALCKKYKLWLIEDNCDSLGSSYDGRFTGTFGDIGTSSFYPPHHLTMGEGGAVYTSNTELRKIMLSIRDWGRDCWCDSGRDDTCGCRFSRQYGSLPFGYDHKYVYSHFGYNLKATDMQAAIGCAQLDKLPEFTAARRCNFARLHDGLSSVKQFLLPVALPQSQPSWFGFMITLRDGTGFSRNEIVEYLEEKKIQTRNLFAGNLTRHPCFDSLREGTDFRISGELKNTDKIMNDSFWIGVYPGMTTEKIDYMIDTIKEFINQQEN
jgi:CDP-6-deoxy-D-xylo-4-hexulose-3-dehydrase